MNTAIRALIFLSLLFAHLPAQAVQYSFFTPSSESPQSVTAKGRNTPSAGQYNPQIAANISKTSVLKFELAGQIELFNVSNVTRKPDGRVAYTAAGETGSSIAVAENNGSVVGSLWRNGSLYKIRSNESGLTEIIETPAQVLRDHDENYSEASYQNSENLTTSSPLAAQINSEQGPQPLDANADSSDEFTVIVAYTSGFAAAAGDVTAYMDLLELETNQAFANSEVATSVNIVYAYQTAYTDSRDFFADRSYFANTSNAEAAELRSLRDQHNADLMIILTGAGYSFCGVAQGIGVSQADAFALASEACATGYYSFGHEIGHLFGARHIITQDPSTTPFSYGHGYCNTTANTWRTVMAYNCPSSTGGPRIQQWSNPNVSLSGAVTGSSSVEDNARVLNERAFTVANFRSSETAPVLSSPVPANAAPTSSSGASHLLRIRAVGAISGIIHYDDDLGLAHQVAASINGDYLEANVPYENGKLTDNGTNYWYAEATNTFGTSRYPSSGSLSFSVSAPPPTPVVSIPEPAAGSTITATGAGQLLRIRAVGATSGVFHYDDDSVISFQSTATVSGDYLEVTVPYQSAVMTNSGTNYWFVEATNIAGTTRYPSSGNLSFTVQSNTGGLEVSDPEPMDGSTVAAGASGQIFRVKAIGATSGTFHYDDDSGFIDYSVAATVNGDYLEATVPYEGIKLTNSGTNFWYVQASNGGGLVRFPAAGNLSFTVTSATETPVISAPEPSDASLVTESALGQLLRIKAVGATSGVIHFDNDSSIDNSLPTSMDGDFIQITVPYDDSSMNNDGTNYWYVEATNAFGTERYPTSGSLSFTVSPLIAAPIVSNPNPVQSATVTEGVSGQLLRVEAQGATQGRFYYDDDPTVDYSIVASVNGNFLEATIPYSSGSLSNNGINYWSVEASNAGGITRFPSSGSLSFTVLPLIPPPLLSNPQPEDDSVLTEQPGGQLFRIQAVGASSGTIYYDDDNTSIDYNVVGTINGDFLEATIPYSGGSLNKDGLNYWYATASNATGTTRFPDSGTVSFKVTPDLPQDQYEDDNQYQNASIVDNAATQTHNIVPFDDNDWAQFTLKAPSDVELVTSGVSGNTRMWLYDESLSEIAFDDDGGDGFFSRIFLTELPAGTYYIQVDEHGNDDVIRDYQLTATYDDDDGEFLLMLVPTIISAIKEKQKNSDKLSSEK